MQTVARSNTMSYNFTWTFTKTPWYVSYNSLFPFGFNGTSNGISVFPDGNRPGFSSSNWKLIRLIGCRKMQINLVKHFQRFTRCAHIHTILSMLPIYNRSNLYGIVERFKHANTFSTKLEINGAVNSQYHALMGHVPFTLYRYNTSNAFLKHISGDKQQM